MSNYIITNGNLYSYDTLTHKYYKYIKKEMVNGKMRYYYSDPEGKYYTKDEPGQYGTFKNEGGIMTSEYVERKRSNKLFSKSYRTEDLSTIVEEVGLLEQNVNYVREKWSKAIDAAADWMIKKHNQHFENKRKNNTEK